VPCRPIGSAAVCAWTTSNVVDTACSALLQRWSDSTIPHAQRLDLTFGPCKRHNGRMHALRLIAWRKCHETLPWDSHCDTRRSPTTCAQQASLTVGFWAFDGCLPPFDIDRALCDRYDRHTTRDGRRPDSPAAACASRTAFTCPIESHESHPSRTAVPQGSPFKCSKCLSVRTRSVHVRTLLSLARGVSSQTWQADLLTSCRTSPLSFFLFFSRNSTC
jgi:hypothetical protein